MARIEGPSTGSTTLEMTHLADVGKDEGPAIGYESQTIIGYSPKRLGRLDAGVLRWMNMIRRCLPITGISGSRSDIGGLSVWMKVAHSFLHFAFIERASTWLKLLFSPATYSSN
jgi:hypothetical protein